MEPKVMMSEMDVLKLKCASYELELVQVRARETLEKATTQRDTLIREILGKYVPEGAMLENYQVNLETGEISERTENA